MSRFAGPKRRQNKCFELHRTTALFVFWGCKGTHFFGYRLEKGCGWDETARIQEDRHRMLWYQAGGMVSGGRCVAMIFGGGVLRYGIFCVDLHCDRKVRMIK